MTESHRDSSCAFCFECESFLLVFCAGPKSVQSQRNRLDKLLGWPLNKDVALDDPQVTITGIPPEKV